MRGSLPPAAAVLGVLATLALPTAAPAAGPANLQCNGAYSGTYANVTVPPNDICTLTNSTVLGNATVGSGGDLELDATTSPTTSSIGGNVLVGANATLSQSSGWTVNGTIAARGAAFLIVGGGTTHDVVSNGSQNVYVYSATVDGSVVANQTQSFGEIASNTVTGDVVANGEPSTSGGFYIEGKGQVIGGSVYITNNQAPTNVFYNTIRQNLVCTGNNPPPSDFGYGNDVLGREVGQCAGFPSSPADGAGSA